MEQLPATRVSDAEREAVALRLREAAVEGRLTLDELSERLGTALAARTHADLEPLTADLPAAGTPTRVSRRAPRRWVVSVMSGHSLRGRFRVAGSLNVISLMGGAEIDLRAAEIDGDTVTIRCVSIMGGASVVVPEGVEVDDTGFAIMGGRDVKVRDVPPVPGTPLVRVFAFALMGGNEVKSKPHRRRDERSE